METLYFRICVFLGLLAGAVIVALPLHRQFADFHDFVRRTPKWQRAFLALLAAVFIAYGSTKTNQVDGVSGGDTNQVEIVGGDGTNAPPPMLMMARPPVLPTVASEDIARGWQLVGVDTNAAVDYAMPEGAVLASNWWVRGAFDDVVRIGLGGLDWRFPFGTNTYSSLWAFAWGKVRFLFDDTNVIAAVGSPMSAVPYRSRLWTFETTNAFLVTWENFALSRDTNTPVNAQVELRRSGDFVTRSNEVETICRRVCPEDWDDDGIPNVRDPRPYSRDGDFFGPGQTLPDGANEDAYCWVEIAAEVNAHVVFTGDGESDLPDPDFMIHAGETNRVTLLIGKTYTVESTQPLAVTDRSDGAIEVSGNGSCALSVVWPVTVYAMEGNGASFMMRVVPNRIGGEFVWDDDCCPITGSGRVFSWGCNGLCLCTGCTAQGALVYEGYSIPVTGGHCGCSYGPRQTETEPDDDQMVAGVSASFSPEAVIFEDAYTNKPGEVVGRRSTETVLSCAVHGGFRGGTATFSFAGETNLVWIRGAAVPQSSVTILPGEKLEFAAAYEGLRPSAEAEDITYTVTFTENDATNGPTVVQAKLTSVKVEITPEETPPENPALHRHYLGVQEKVNYRYLPPDAEVVWSDHNGGRYIDIDDYEQCFYCPWIGDVYRVYVECGSQSFDIPLEVIEPGVECLGVRWNEQLDTNAVEGVSGWVGMSLLLYLTPRTVAFQRISMVEIPVPESEAHELSEDDYFSLMPDVLTKTHDSRAGAGRWKQPQVIGSGYYWTGDLAQMPRECPPLTNCTERVWAHGRMQWDIPVGWGMTNVVHGSMRQNPTDQVYEMEPDGSLTIRKYRHWIKRDVSGRVWLDGSRVNAWWSDL